MDESIRKRRKDEQEDIFNIAPYVTMKEHWDRVFKAIPESVKSEIDKELTRGE